MKAYGQLILDKNNKYILEFTTDYIESPITEAITKEQKELGQREMSKINLDPFLHLRNYLIEKWQKPLKTKKDFLQKNIEFERFNKILNIMKKAKPKYENPARIAFKQSTGIKQKRIHVFNSNDDKNGIRLREVKGIKIPYLLLDRNFNIDEFTNGFLFDFGNSEIPNKVYNFMINHELGHIYEYLKNLVENDSAELVDTINEKDRNKVIDSEGKANAYAIDNMYRKDRRELLKNGKEINSINVSKEYIDGLKKYSKTYSKTKDSIEKENSHFEY